MPSLQSRRRARLIARAAFVSVSSGLGGSCASAVPALAGSGAPANWRASVRAASGSNRGAEGDPDGAGDGNAGSTVNAFAAAGTAGAGGGNAIASGAAFRVGAAIVRLAPEGRAGAGAAFGGGGGCSQTTIDVRAAGAGAGWGALAPWRQANSSAACSASDTASPAARRDFRGRAMSGSSEKVGFTGFGSVSVTHVGTPSEADKRWTEMFIKCRCPLDRRDASRYSSAPRSVAQPGSAPGLGPGGPRFESLYSDQH